MAWLSVLPVAATLLAQAPAAAPPVEPVVAPIATGPSVGAPPAPALQAPAPSAVATRWYGAPTVAADVAAAVLVYGVAEYNADYRREHPGFNAPGATPVALVLLLSTAVNGAIVHGIHHQPTRAAASVFLRSGALLTAFVLGSNGHCGGQENPDCTGELVLLASIPLLAISADDAFLAREPLPAAAPAQHAWTPTLRIQSGLAMLGVGTSF
jgi:hypothetical protein